MSFRNRTSVAFAPSYFMDSSSFANQVRAFLGAEKDKASDAHKEVARFLVLDADLGGSAHDGAITGGVAIMYETAAPAATDQARLLRLEGLNSAVEPTTYAALDIITSTLTDASEGGTFLISTMQAGTVTEIARMSTTTKFTTAGFEVEQGATGGAAAFTVDNDDVDQIAISIEAANTTADIINFDAAALTTGKAIDISNLAAITTGKAIHVDATGITHTSGVLVHLDSAGTVITGGGRIFMSDHTGTTTTSGVLNELKSAATDETVIVQILASSTLLAGKMLNLSGVSMTTGTALSIDNLNALTSGLGVSVTSTAPAITGAGRLFSVYHNATTTSGGTIAEIRSAATDTTKVLQVTSAGSGNAADIDGPVDINPIGYYNTQEGLSSRFRLVWVAGQRGKPGLNADILSATEATREIADPDFEILGTNCVSTCSTFDAEGGIILTTTAVAADQVILAPHLDANQTAWTQVTWGTDQQTRWECVITDISSLVDSIVWAGLKLTNTAVVATDNDQVFFRYEEGVQAGNWQAVSSIGGVDDAADAGVVAATGTVYHFLIDIASDRTAKMYINGALVKTTTALTNTTDFIPYIGIEVQTGGAAGAKAVSVRGQAASRNFA